MLQDLENASKQDLIEEIKRLRGDQEDQPAEAEGDDDLLQLDEDFFNTLMNFGGFDLNNIMMQFIDSMLNNIPTPAYCLNMDGEIVSYNKGFLAFCGFDAQKIDVIKLEHIFSSETLYEETKINKEVFGNNDFVSYETVFQMKNEEMKDAAVSKSVFQNFDGSLVGLITVINDVTEKKAAERALVTSERKLRELNSTKDKLFSIISHDLKNPVLAVLSISNMLKNDFDSFESEDIHSFLNDITNSAEQTYTLLENLLQWSLSQRGQLKLNHQLQRLSLLVDETIEVFDAAAKSKYIDIITEVPKDLAGVFDRNTILTVFRNLVSNAIKFTNNSGKIVISSRVYDSYVEVLVKDSGIGIAEEDLEKLFKLEVDTSTIGNSVEKGTGLGLILCKEFVELNNGKIYAESDLNIGTTFIFTLPKEK